MNTHTTKTTWQAAGVPAEGQGLVGAAMAPAASGVATKTAGPGAQQGGPAASPQRPQVSPPAGGIVAGAQDPQYAANQQAGANAVTALYRQFLDDQSARTGRVYRPDDNANRSDFVRYLRAIDPQLAEAPDISGWLAAASPNIVLAL